MTTNNSNIPPLNPEHPEDHGVRKLCAIMFTDIKDFSGRMQRDEVSTMRMLGIHNRMMTEAVNKYGGVVIKTVGDAFLVTFDSVVSATQCAVEVQQQFIQYNVPIKNVDEKITVRIGVHLGDVFVKNKDVFGDGVNIASRIQSMAEPGSVNISESVYQQVHAKLNIKVINLGIPQLKGIATPVKVYQVIVIPTDKARGKIATNIFVFQTILKRKKTKRIIGISFGVILLAVASFWYFFSDIDTSLAILPFQYLSSDSSSAYIANEFAEDLLSEFSRTTNIRVISFGRTLQYKNMPEKSESDIAKELNVRYLVVGSISLKGNSVTVKFRLTEPAKDKDIIPTTSYEKSRDELNSIEWEIMRSLTGLFTSQLEEGGYKTKPEVFEKYLEGLGYDRKQQKEDNKIAISLFRQAVEKDSNYIPAYLKLASCQLLNLERGYDNDEKWMTDAEQNIHKLYVLDSTNAEVYLLLGRLAITKGDHKQGIVYLEKAIQINPNQMRPYVTLGLEYLQNTGDPATAITYFNKAYEIEPSNFNISINLGIAQAMSKNYEEAEKNFKKAISLNPTHETPWINLGYLYELLGNTDSAEVAFENAIRRNPKDALTTEHLAMLLLNKGRLVPAEEAINATLKFDPANYRLIYVLGITKYKQGDKNDALTQWKQGQQLASANAKQNPSISDHNYFLALFSARLGEPEKAIASGLEAVRMDSAENNVMLMARIYAILDKKKEMITWFSKARSMNAEYDEAFLSADIDFEKYRGDQDLLLASRR